MTRLFYPERVELAQTPTPVTPLRRLSARLNIELIAKRDDLTGAALSGNKVRKLEFLFAQALQGPAGRGTPYRGVITCGGEQSNHARATAVAAARLGLSCHLLLRTAKPKKPPPPIGNILLDRVVGASIQWITPAQYRQRDRLMAEHAQQLKDQGEGDWYVIPEGASNALGCWGYVCCAEELVTQIGHRPATVIVPVGSGGTAAGLIAGTRLLGLPYRIVGVCVCDDAAFFQQRISDLLDDMARCFDVDVCVPPAAVDIWQDYVGKGYAQSREEELRCIADVAQLEGLVTDPVYSGKAFYGLVSERKRGRALQSPVVFVHTGGIYGLLAKGNQIAPLL